MVTRILAFSVNSVLNSILGTFTILAQNTSVCRVNRNVKLLRTRSPFSLDIVEFGIV